MGLCGLWETITMKCKFCKSIEELKWPENYKKGDRPVNAETGAKHTCRKESDSGFLDIPASVGIQSTLTEDTNPYSVNHAQNVREGECD